MSVLTDERAYPAARLPSPRHEATFDRRHTAQPVVLVVEGIHDIDFLRRVGRLLRHADPQVVDLARLEQDGRLVFLPQGGGGVSAWADRLMPLRCPQLYLFDREGEAAMQSRLRTAELINRRTNCRAFVTRKRALENYLHPAAILDARRLAVVFTDDEDVAAVVARRQWETGHKPLVWSQLSLRAQYRLRAKAKKWLNTLAVEQMTIERLAKRDPHWEILSWCRAVGELLGVVGP
jgi:putative ATP-dependent endonuclease of OLD family